MGKICLHRLWLACLVQILWTHDNMELPDDHRFVVSMTQDETTSTVHHVSLAISDVTTQDAGTYRVQATNIFGQESASVSLIVNRKFPFPVPVFVKDTLSTFL